MLQTLLLVEDDPLIAKTEQLVLEKAGYQVLTASTGEMAVETALGRDDIDLILMDINLGEGMDGTAAAEKILAKKHLPIMFLSSHTEPEVVERTEGITGYGYILKNSDATVLLASIRMAFRLFESRQREKESLEERERVVDALQALAETGMEDEDHILRFIVRELARALQVRYAFVARIKPDSPDFAQTLAIWTGQEYGENFTYELSGAPCKNVVEQGDCFYPEDVTSLFPDHLILRDLGVESYWGTPLRDRNGEVLGLLVAMDTKPLTEHAWCLSLLQSFALRAAQEISRDREVKELSVKLQERIKELQALLGVVQLVTDPKRPLREVVETIIEKLIWGMQFPELVSMRITLSGVVYTSPHFTLSAYCIKEDVMMGDSRTGDIELYYRENPLPGGSDPFLPEERNLIKAVKDQLVSFLDRKRSLLSIEKSEERYRTLFEQTNTGICIVDIKSGIVTECNPAFAQLIGESRPSVIGRNYQSLGCEKDFDDITAHINRPMHVRLKHSSGEILEMELRSDLVSHRGRSLLQCTLSSPLQE
jgi:PAS domain S-box-containing protein